MKSSPRILSVIGTRPDAIKMAPLVHLLNIHLGNNHRVCSTGQHVELLNSVLHFFEICPDYQLDLMTERQDLLSLIAKTIIAISPVLEEFAPDWVLVHGDTATCLGATLAAFYKQIHIGHVEAGLRSGSLSEPFPEESVRILTDQLAEVCFVPSEAHKANLVMNGKPADKILMTGNTGIDSLYYVLEHKDSLSENVPPAVRALMIENPKLILITVHRFENQGDNLISICAAIRKIACMYPEARMLVPLHPNPAVMDCLIEQLSGIDSILLCTPLAYPDFIWIMKHCYLILTDSGGIQEEAPVLGKPVFLLRNKTERQEMVASGNVKIIGTEINAIVAAVDSVWNDDEKYRHMTQPVSTYGNGTASEQIVDFLLNY